MAKGKPPALDLSACPDDQESIELWLDQFNDWCTLQGWRDTAKPVTDKTHWKTENYGMEISAFRLALPVNVWRTVKSTIVPTMTEGDDENTSKKHPWVWQKKLLQHYSGKDTVLSMRMTFMETCRQKAGESIAEFETRCKYLGSKCDYSSMKNPEDELIRDRFVTGVFDDKLRAELLRHKKDDGSVIPLADVINKAKAWEAANKTNTRVIESHHTEEQVNFTNSQSSNSNAKHYKGRYQQSSRSNSNRLSKSRSCGYCGAPQLHSKKVCPAGKPGVVCKNCYGENHFANVCRSTKDRFKYKLKNSVPVNSLEIQNADSDYSDEFTHDYALSVDNNGFSQTPVKKIFVSLNLSANGDIFKKMKFQIDTAASCNTMSYNMYQRIGFSKTLSPSKSILHSYSGKAIKPLGKCTLLSESETSFNLIDFEIIDDDDVQNKPALLGSVDSIRLELIKYDDSRVESVNSITSVTAMLSKDDMLKMYPDVFRGIGNLGKPVSFVLDDTITPVHAPNHRIPLSKRKRTKAKLDEMVKAGKLSKVDEPTDWCSNMTVVEKVKPNGQIKTRICIDPSQTVNKALTIPKYTIPTLQEILPEFSSRKYKTFSIVDALDGFTQVSLDAKSSSMTTMSTPWGRYKWNRLPYGISSAVEEFQKRMHEAVEGLECVLGIADDLVVYGLGHTQEEADKNHDINLLALLNRALERNLKLNPEKIQFKLKKISFMGHCITEEGVKPDLAKINAITQMPVPHNAKSLQRFIGMVNYLNSFCPTLADTISPLHNLTRQDTVFLWTEVHQRAFEKAKQLISSAPCLAYFDVTKQIVLQVDASEVALGGALLQPDENNKLKPVAFTSCLLRPNENNWAQIEKETLAICNACEKWDLWIYGKQIIIHTDHQPLETIFKKPLSKAPKRLQKLMMRLQRYSLQVTYKKGSSLVLADTLSRAPLQQVNTGKVNNFEIFRIEVERSDTQLNDSRLTSKTTTSLQQASKSDQIMNALAHVIVNGWPRSRSELPEGLPPFWNFRDELTINNGIIFKGTQALIPVSMQRNMLQKIHTSHLGAESNIKMCKDIVFWPGMQAAIKDMCGNCTKCAMFTKENKREHMLSQPIPEYPWQFASQDLFQFESRQFLVSVDHYSDFIELDELENTLSKTVIDKAKTHFGRHGIPEVLLTDNGPQFISSEFANFCNEWNIEHNTSSPYWPKGNGKAEAAVKVAKGLLKKSADLNLGLLHYRNTPNKGHSLSPVQRCMNRRSRSTLPIMKSLLKPTSSSDVQQEILRKQARSKHYYDRNVTGNHKELKLSAEVYAKPPPHRRGTPWIRGHIVAKPSPRSYVVRTVHGDIRRNRNQLNPVKSNSSNLISHDLDKKILRPSPNTPQIVYDRVSNSEVCSRPLGSVNTLGHNDSVLNNESSEEKVSSIVDDTSIPNVVNVNSGGIMMDGKSVDSAEVVKSNYNIEKPPKCQHKPVIQGTSEMNVPDDSPEMPYVTRFGRTVKKKAIFDPSN